MVVGPGFHGNSFQGAYTRPLHPGLWILLVAMVKQHERSFENVQEDTDQLNPHVLRRFLYVFLQQAS